MRLKCYDCFRPVSSCICDVSQKIETESEFIILMHPMERQKIKNNTGFITHHSLVNSKLIEGINFSDDAYLNQVLNCTKTNVYLLYPFKESRSLTQHIQSQNSSQKKMKNIFILIDSTWPCAKKILKLSPNLQKAAPLTFEKLYLSAYKIKEQPKDGFISTIETVKIVMEDLIKNNLEVISKDKMDHFLDPFTKINDYQLECINNPLKETYQARLKRNKT